MKYLMLYGLIFLISCSNNNSSEETKSALTSSTETKSAPSSGDGIPGEWEMVGFIVDTNDNLKIDEDERKNLKTSGYKDYMKLNSDGSGLFTIAKLEGRYEVNVEGSDGKKFLYWYNVRSNSEHRIGTIISVTKDELQIKEPGGSGLILWKRL